MTKLAADVSQGVIFEVDDEPLTTGLKPRHVEELDATREIAESLEEAVVKAEVIARLQRNGDVNTVMALDLMFPERKDPSEGTNFIEAVRQGQLELDPRTPIVVHSNAGDRATRDEALASGANAFFKKVGDPRPFLDCLAFYLGKEVVSASANCEVVTIDVVKKEVRIRLRGKNGYLAERTLDLDMCPLEAQVEGGAFHLDTIKRFRQFKVECIVRSRTVDLEREAKLLEEILGKEGGDRNEG